MAIFEKIRLYLHPLLKEPTVSWYHIFMQSPMGTVSRISLEPVTTSLKDSCIENLFMILV